METLLSIVETHDGWLNSINDHCMIELTMFIGRSCPCPCVCPRRGPPAPRHVTATANPTTDWYYLIPVIELETDDLIDIISSSIGMCAAASTSAMIL